MLDLKALTVFVRVAERRSFVRAARELGMTQSGVSNAISRLEAQLGVLLLARTTRSVNLTEDGAAFHERCRQILSDLDQAEQVLTQAGGKPSGRLHVDMPVCFGRLKVVPLLGRFRALYPDLRLAVSAADRYADLVEEGIDIAFRFGALHDSSLIARRLTRTQFRIVGSPAYLAAHGRPRSPEDLAKHNCLAFTSRQTGLARNWRLQNGGDEVTFTPKGDMTFTDGAALADAVAAGYGLGQMHDYYTDSAIAAGELKPVLERFKPDADSISLVYPPSRHLAPKVRAFIDYMIAAFR